MKIYLSSKGIRPDIDNSGVVNRAIERAKEGDTIVWKNGFYPIAETIVQSKRIHWEGQEATLVPSKPITAIKFLGGLDSRINNIAIHGGYSIHSDHAETFSAIQVSAVVRMDTVKIRNMWGNGLTVSADIGSGNGNASWSHFHHIQVIECKDHGFYFQGGDANQCTIDHCDVRDCNGIGFYDHSFLGNSFRDCMTHNNKKGSFRADDVNNRAGFYQCYAEMGQGKIYLGGTAGWFGGLPSDGIEYHENAYSFPYIFLNREGSAFDFKNVQ